MKIFYFVSKEKHKFKCKKTKALYLNFILFVKNKKINNDFWELTGKYSQRTIERFINEKNIILLINIQINNTKSYIQELLV